jgi:hypothetical protein
MTQYIALVAPGSDLPEGFDLSVHADGVEEAHTKFEAYFDSLGVVFQERGSFIEKVVSEDRS